MVVVGSFISSRAPDRFVRPVIAFVIYASGLKYIGLGTTQLGWTLVPPFWPPGWYGASGPDRGEDPATGPGWHTGGCIPPARNRWRSRTAPLSG